VQIKQKKGKLWLMNARENNFFKFEGLQVLRIAISLVFLSLLQIRFFENIVSYSRPKEYIPKPKIQV
jgi:hypothetical protein